MYIYGRPKIYKTIPVGPIKMGMFRGAKLGSMGNSQANNVNI
jgi:hypothetical protein